MAKISKSEYIKQVRTEAQRKLREAEMILQFCHEAELDNHSSIEILEEQMTKKIGFH